MNREQLIQSIVARKLSTGTQSKVVCVCFAAARAADRQTATKVSR
jgi:hypothetical protein